MHIALFDGLPLMSLMDLPVAFILSCMTVVAYFMAHAPKALLPILNQGELAVMFCFVFLYFAAAGGGAFSADAAIKKN